MKRWAVLLLAFTTGACGTTLPEGYGTYLRRGRELTLLRPHAPEYRGYMWAGQIGVLRAEGPSVVGVTDIVVFEKGVSPSALKLSKLARNEAHLWVPAEQVESTVSPVDDRPDMYVLRPTKELGPGFYAVHVTTLGSGVWIESMERGSVWDFVIGDRSAFVSYEEQRAQMVERYRTEAQRIAAKFNEQFNAGDYSLLDDIFRPKGTISTREERQKLLDGMNLWRLQSGAAVGSRVVGVEPSESGDRAVVRLETRYDKVGIRNEIWTLTLVGGRVFVTAIE